MTQLSPAQQRVITAMREQPERPLNVTQILMLDQYKSITNKIAALEKQKQEIHDALKGFVDESGQPLEAYGYRCHMKPGRKSTDHKAIVYAVVRSEEINDSDALEVEAIIAKHTITKHVTSWAKVTKEASPVIPQSLLDQHTTQARAKFVIEKAK